MSLVSEKSSETKLKQFPIFNQASNERWINQLETANLTNGTSESDAESFVTIKNDSYETWTSKILYNVSEIELLNISKRVNNSNSSSKPQTKPRDPYVLEKIKAGVPIDHGWAWMIVLACHTLCLIVSGLQRSHGILIVEIAASFETTTVEAAWCFGMANLLSTLLAPVSTSIAVKFTSRIVVWIGGCFIVVGMILTSFINSVPLLFLTYGLLVGIGFGLVYAPAMCIVGYYFDLKRTIANGISVAGSSMGSIIMPFVIETLITEYSCQKAFIVLAGLALHVFVAGALCRPMEYYTSRAKLELQNEEEEKYRNIGIVDEIISADETGSSLSFTNEIIDRSKRKDKAALGLYVMNTLSTLEEHSTDKENSPSNNNDGNNSVNECPSIINTNNNDNTMIKSKSQSRRQIEPGFQVLSTNHNTEFFKKMNLRNNQRKFIDTSNALYLCNPLEFFKSDNNSAFDRNGQSATSNENDKQLIQSCNTVFIRSDSKFSVPALKKDGLILLPLESNSERISPDIPVMSESTLQSVRKEMVRLTQTDALTRPLEVSKCHTTVTSLFCRATSFLVSQSSVNQSEKSHKWRKNLDEDHSNSIAASGFDLTFASLQNLPQDPVTSLDRENGVKLLDAAKEFFAMRQKVITNTGKVKESRGVSLFDPWVFHQPRFYMLSIAIMISMNVFGIIFILLPGHAVDLGVKRYDAGRLVQFAGVADLIGRLLTAFFADRLCVSKTKLFLFNVFTITGAWIFLLLVDKLYIALVVFASVISFSGGSNMSIFAVLLVETLGVARLSSTFGVTLFFSGAFGYIQVLIFSWLRDTTLSWVCAIYINIGLCIFTILVIILDIIYCHCQQLKRKPNE